MNAKVKKYMEQIAAAKAAGNIDQNGNVVLPSDGESVEAEQLRAALSLAQKDRRALGIAPTQAQLDHAEDVRLENENE